MHETIITKLILSSIVIDMNKKLYIYFRINLSIYLLNYGFVWVHVESNVSKINGSIWFHTNNHGS